jgi:hypothetical protein
MKCPYINPTYECLTCKFDDCTRDERQDQREHDKIYYSNNKSKIRARQHDRYYSSLEISREYYRDKAKVNYDTEKNTAKCHKYYIDNIEKKKQYDRDRYYRQKAEKEKVKQ